MTTEEKTYLSIIENNKGIFIGICNVYTNSNEDFEDLYQDILLNIWKALPSFNNKSKLSTWLYRIALNVSIRYNTKRKKGIKNNKLESITITEDVSNKVENQESIDLLYRCINTLNDIDKSIVTLYLEDLPYVEISKVVGISENYVSVKLKRIKKKLFHCLKINQ